MWGPWEILEVVQELDLRHANSCGPWSGLGSGEQNIEISLVVILPMYIVYVLHFIDLNTISYCSLWQLITPAEHRVGVRWRGGVAFKSWRWLWGRTWRGSCSGTANFRFSTPCCYLRVKRNKTRLTYNCAHLRSTKEKKEKIIHNICSQKIMPYFFDKLSTSIRNFAQWASTFCFSFLNFWVKFCWVKIF